MAVVTFQCDICKRKIEIPQNRHGLETIGRCIITEGCRGHLNQLKVNPDFVRGNLPPDVSGLENWIQRKVLFTFEQSLASSTWKIVHGLNTEPSVQIFAYIPVDDTQVLTEIAPTSVTVIDSNTMEIELPHRYTGIAQFIARSTGGEVVVPAQTPIGTSSLTISSLLTIATLDGSSSIDLDVQFLSPTTGLPLPFDPVTLTFSNAALPSTSAWNGTRKVLIHGKIYTVRGLDITSAVVGIAQDSPFYFVDTLPEKTFILLTNSPFTQFDRNLSSIVDINSVTADNASVGFFYQSGEFYTYDTIKESVYPLIKSAL